MQEETICAPSTAIGGAIAIIRISGKDAITITERIFKPVKKGLVLSEAKPYSLIYGSIVSLKDAIIDNVLVSVFRAPHSYTGEDCIEISCHGSRYIINEILQELTNAGCRQALPGEFTQRAFLNGKMDLTQAEAVADLIASTSKAQHNMALGQLRGNVSNKLAELRKNLLTLTSLLELELDFSDQDVEFADRERLNDLAVEIQTTITSLIQSFKTGKAIKHGITVAIVGKTNVGKSTLLNALIGEEKAIVSNIHGTTRDIIEDTTIINGITFRFVDTAGLRETSDTIEKIGIERAYKKMEEASIILWMTDAIPTIKETDEILNKIKDKPIIHILNKCDELNNYTFTKELSTSISTICISAKYMKGISELEQALYKIADIPSISNNDVIVTSVRHYDILTQAYESISRVVEGLSINLSGDLLSEDLRLCINQLGEISGNAITTEETLQSIFSSFCIGK